MREKEKIDLLVSIDQNYLHQLETMLLSVFLNNADREIRVYLLYRRLSAQNIEELTAFCTRHVAELIPVRVPVDLLGEAVTYKRYPLEMYDRLLAGQLLPEDCRKVIYLDPDILVINPISTLWEQELGDNLFAAAAHRKWAKLTEPVNKIRLDMDNSYFNSGVLLINLERARDEIHVEDLVAFTEEHKNSLLLPDQDMLNSLYGDRIVQLDDLIWNYDARHYQSYLTVSHGEADISWIMTHTSVIHYCGKDKPWKPHHRHRLGVLYKHYFQMAARECGFSAETYFEAKKPAKKPKQE